MPQGLAAVFEYFGASASAASTAGYAVSTAAVIGAGIYESQSMKRLAMPPSPLLSQQSIDQSQADAEQRSRQRASIAGGLASTVGTSGGQSGSTLNPNTLATSSLLGK